MIDKLIQLLRTIKALPQRLQVPAMIFFSCAVLGPEGLLGGYILLTDNTDQECQQLSDDMKKLMTVNENLSRALEAMAKKLPDHSSSAER